MDENEIIDESGWEDYPELENPDLDTESDQVDPEALRAQIRAEMEEEVQQHKSNISRKWDTARRDAQAKGLDFSDTGEVLFRDPATLMRNMAGIQPQQEQAPESIAPPDILYSSPEDLGNYVQQTARAMADQMLTPVQEELRQLREMLSDAAMSPQTPVIDRAREYLEELDMGDAADIPQFREIFNNAMKQAGPGAMRDENSIRAAAGMALGLVAKEVKQNRASQPARAAQTPDMRGLQRAALNQVGASRGASPARGGVSEDTMLMFNAMPREWGIASPQELAALEDPTGDSWKTLISRRKKQ